MGHTGCPGPARLVPGGLLPPHSHSLPPPSFLLASSLLECFFWVRADIVLLLLLGWFPLALAASLEHIPPHSSLMPAQLHHPIPLLPPLAQLREPPAGLWFCLKLRLALSVSGSHPCPSPLDPPHQVSLSTSDSQPPLVVFLLSKGRGGEVRVRRPTALGHSCWGQSWEGMSSLWGEGDEAQLLESYLWMILHSREQTEPSEMAGGGY